MDILDWYVTNITEQKDGSTAFLVVAVFNPSTRFTVYRRDKEWHCLCDTPTVWVEGSRISLSMACIHIRRAYYYYCNMLQHAEKMKQELKGILEQNKACESGPVLPFGNKRKIQVED
jgi:hypothetical protein